MLEGLEDRRAALNRATRKAGRHVAKASDAKYLNIWDETKISEGGSGAS